MQMKTRIFEDWLATFRSSINEYNYYTDFEKVYCNVEDLKVEINILNSLVGSKNIEAEFEKLLQKNRGGHQMENLVESFLKKSSVKYYKEMYLNEVEEKFKIDLSAISAGGTSTKRFDFVVESEKIFGIETNFYTGGGSKLNETARSYKMIAEESKAIKNFEFVWITDGEGWRSARRNLKETFLILENLYNITDLENGIFEEIFKN